MPNAEPVIHAKEKAERDPVRQRKGESPEPVLDDMSDAVE
jgi:hypothetical protein